MSDHTRSLEWFPFLSFASGVVTALDFWWVYGTRSPVWKVRAGWFVIACLCRGVDSGECGREHMLYILGLYGALLRLGFGG